MSDILQKVHRSQPARAERQGIPETGNPGSFSRKRSGRTKLFVTACCDTEPKVSLGDL